MHTKFMTQCTMRRRCDAAIKETNQGGGHFKEVVAPQIHVKLVYNLMFPGQMSTLPSTISDLGECSISSARTLSLLESGNKAKIEEDIDFDCDTG
jgi:hypothetical protein